MTKYFSLDYIFAASPESANNIIVTYLILFVSIIILAIVISMIFAKKSKKILPYKDIQERVLYHGIAIGSVGLLLTFFLWQQIPYLSSPIVVYILLGVFIYLAVTDIIFYNKETKSEITRFKQEIKYRKYLPKKSKK